MTHHRIEVLRGDITTLDVDAIVNAANERMLGGAGVDGAIHRAAGPELRRACEQVAEVRPGVRCPTGEARITPGFRLPARYVIHTVGPVWSGGTRGEAEQLAGCYRSSIELAQQHGLASIAFPAISCGVFRYPVDAACELAVRTLMDALRDAPAVERVLLVAFDAELEGELERALAAASVSPPTPDADLVDRARGALLGLACGDALGTTVEFKPRGSFEPVTDIVGGGPFRLEPGQWTDDTSMALCLADSLISCRGFDPHDQMQRYVRWMNEGYLSSNGRCFDIGHTTRGALTRFLETDHPFSGPVAPDTAGNGSIMRLAPIPIAFHANPSEAIRFGGESSRTTHGAAEAVSAARMLASVLVALLGGEDRDAALAGMHIDDDASDRLREIADGSYRTKTESEIRGSGYVVECLEAALWCFVRADHFEEAVLMAVNLGDDADTTGAVCGQLAGACWGASAIPRSWAERLTMAEEIRNFADRLLGI